MGHADSHQTYFSSFALQKLVLYFRISTRNHELNHFDEKLPSVQGTLKIHIPQEQLHCNTFTNIYKEWSRKMQSYANV